MSATTPTTAPQAQGTAPQKGGPVVRVTVPRRTFVSELRAIKIVWQRELIRFFSDRLRMVTSLVQPFLFLFVLGSGLSNLTEASTGGVSLRTFLYPGILAMAVVPSAGRPATLTRVQVRPASFERKTPVPK